MRNPRIIFVILLALLANFFLFSVLAPKAPSRTRVPYSPQFLSQVTENNVKDVSSQELALQGDFKSKVKIDGKDVERFKTEIPAFADQKELDKLLQTHNVEVNAKPPDAGPGFLTQVLLGFGPTILLVLLFVFLMRRAAAGGAGGPGGIMGQFGRAQARRGEDSLVRVSFADVAGIDEAKAELSEIVDFLREPDKYARLGARIPRGVLLSGMPGTGKTLLARAVAGEAGVPFFSISASEFVEAIVGVGASRVRDLFKQAKDAAPAIVFIDELDAIGRSRSAGGGFSGGHDEREQTLNQILTEMDGFEPGAGVIVLAATNRPEILDSALLRPGRFDRRVAVQPPDRDGRRRILEVHTRGKPLADDIDLAQLASTTPGMVGADLANLCNEAALLAARRGNERIGAADFTDALEKVILGAERKIVMLDSDRERTAYHEAGHALVGMLTPGADPVRKVSIIPRGMALGVTLSTPETDRFSYDRVYLMGRIKVALGGRGAELVVFGETTTGAESDIQQLTQIARQMVGRWGMSDAVGPVAVIPSAQNGPLLPGVSETSEHTQETVDEEVRRIVEEAEREVVELLTNERDKLDAMVAALMEHETLDHADAYASVGLEPPAEGEPVVPTPV
jgi:cell division protease FtsH